MDFKTLRLRTVFPITKTQAVNRMASGGATAVDSISSAGASVIAVEESGFQDEARPTIRTTIKRPPHTWVYAAIAGDWIMAVLASVAAFWIRFHTSLRDVGIFEDRTLEQYGGHAEWRNLVRQYHARITEKRRARKAARQA